jgi:hypothetical protein
MNKMNNVKTDEQIVEQSNGLEKVICELERLNALVYRGYSIDTVSRYITEDNVERIKEFLSEAVTKGDTNIRMHLVVS